MDQLIDKTYPSFSVYSSIDGMRYFLFDCNEVISDTVRQKGAWNQKISLLINSILDVTPESGRVLEIGAGFGSIGLPLAKNNQHFVFELFEAQKTIFNQLCGNIMLNNLSNVNAHKVALHNYNGIVDAPVLNVEFSGNHGSLSLLKEFNDVRNLSFADNLESMDCKTLDSFNFDDVKLLKISVCGMEAMVLEGAKETLLNNNLPPVIVESWEAEFNQENRRKCFDIFKDLGYKKYIPMGEHVLFSSDMELSHIATNFVATVHHLI